MTTTELEKAASVVTGASEDTFTANTGYSRTRATRTVNAVLTVIGATMADNLPASAQFGGAINVLGMSIAEVIAGTGASKQQRDELIAALAAFVTKTADDLSQHYAEVAALAQFAAKTTNEDLTPSNEAGVAN